MRRSSLRTSRGLPFGAVLLLSLVLGVSARAGAATVPAPKWRLTVTPGPTHFASGDNTGLDTYLVTAINIGGAATDGTPVTISNVLPAGVKLDPAGPTGRDDHEEVPVSCEAGPPVTCIDADVVQPDEAVKITIPVDIEAGAASGLPDEATVSGGGAASAAASATTIIDNGQVSSGFQSLTSALTNADGTPESQAGSHPYEFTLRLSLNAIVSPVSESLTAAGEPRDVTTDLPAGLVVNPSATAVKCTETELESDANHSEGGGCPAASQVGIVRIKSGLNRGVEVAAALFNMVAPAGVPAELGFDAVGAGVFVHLLGGVRSGSDFGLSSTTPDIDQKGLVSVVEATLWGDPTEASHDLERGLCVTAFSQREADGGCPSVERRTVPFLTLPSACTSSLTTSLSLDTWQEPGVFLPPQETAVGGTSGCEKLPFDPTTAIAPSEPASPVADSPSGLEVNLQIPQEESFSSLAESNVKDVVVSFPAGVSVSPSAANGLGACTPAEIQLHSEGLVGSCPDSAKIGTTEVVTPLLEKPLRGALYVAQQGNAGAAQGANPFNSLLAVYLVAEASGVRLKLAGHVEADAATGQLTVRFEGNPPEEGEPQLPFSALKVKLFGGPRAALSMPSGCGTYQAKTTLTPWSGGPSVSRTSSFTVSSGCAEGFTPSFVAGTTSAQAGAFSQLQLTLKRQDGEQDLGDLTATLPPGLLAKLAGVPQCGAAEASAGTCPESSRIGGVTVGAGPGADPVYVTGGVYLTGPYNGGPFGEVVEVPAIAGPFNLGEVTVRGSIRIDPSTAQATIVSDPFPTILQGIPLQVRSVSVALDRPGFTLNPTNCSASSVTGTVASSQNKTTAVSSPFEVANCATLPFKPSFTASTQGKTSKADGASLEIGITSGGVGQADIAKVDLTIPAILPSRLTTLQKACTETQFNANPAGCPPASSIATAIVHTPLLSNPLEGPVYFVSHGGAAFPDTEMVLQGEGVTLILDGHTQITKGVTYSRFEAIPDAPFTSFKFNAPEGPYSIFGANGNLCQTEVRMPTTLVGQNGAVLNQSTLVQPEGCPNAITVVSRSVHKRTITLKVAVPGAGKLTAKGAHLAGVTKTAKGRSTLTLNIKASGHGRLSTRVKLSFAPGKGRRLAGSVAVKVKG
jgi:hypothetical protein